MLDTRIYILQNEKTTIDVSKVEEKYHRLKTQ